MCSVCARVLCARVWRASAVRVCVAARVMCVCTANTEQFLSAFRIHARREHFHYDAIDTCVVTTTLSVNSSTS